MSLNFFFFHFPQSNQFICKVRQLRIRSIGNNISAFANDLIPFQSKTAFWLIKTATFGNDRGAELMQSGSHFCLKFPREYATLLPLPPLGSIIQSAKPLCCKILHVAPNKTQLMSITVKKKKTRNKGAKHNQMADMPTHEKWQFGARINYWWGTHGVLGSGVVFTKVNSCHEWWAQLAALHIFKRLNRHCFNCKQLIFKWIFHTSTRVFRI